MRLQAALGKTWDALPHAVRPGPAKATFCDHCGGQTGLLAFENRTHVRNRFILHATLAVGGSLVDLVNWRIAAAWQDMASARLDAGLAHEHAPAIQLGLHIGWHLRRRQV